MKFPLKSLVLYLLALPLSVLHGKELQILPVKDLKPYLTYTKRHDAVRLDFERFPLDSSPSATWNSPVIPETFVLTIPQGRVYTQEGYVIVAEKFLIKELLWPWSDVKRGKKKLVQEDLPQVQHVQGSVVVLTQEGHCNYYHWISEILPKLALLRDVAYDWIYLPHLVYPFQKETLALLAIDPKKIIEANTNTYLEADELIVPSFVSKSCYTPGWVAQYLRATLMQPLQQDKTFSKKVFISRQKAPCRRVTNEDEVFNLFKELGFERYNLEDLTFGDQVQLFQNADTVVAFHGAGLTNILFMKPGSQVIELFQAREDDSYCYLSQTLNLNYEAVSTTQFNKKDSYRSTTVPLDLMRELIARKFSSDQDRR